MESGIIIREKLADLKSFGRFGSKPNAAWQYAFAVTSSFECTLAFTNSYGPSGSNRLFISYASKYSSV